MKRLLSDKSTGKTSFLEALGKLEAFCAYQERCQFEVEQKMIGWTLNQEQKDQLIAHLIANRFIDEERFAEAFVSGKFRIKKWGKIKIKSHLKAKRVSEYSVSKALNTIDGDEYYETLKNLASSKIVMIKEKDEWIKKSKLTRFLSARGFEQDLIYEVIKEM